MISFIIVNYNSYQYVEQLINNIHSIVRSLDYEIIVWDNASPIHQPFTHYEQTTIYYGKENGGFGSGCNLAAEKAKGNYLLFINPDVTIISENLFKQYQLLDTGIIGLLGCKHITEEKKVENAIRRFPSLREVIKNIFYLNVISDYGDLKNQVHQKLITCQVVSGSFLLITKKIFYEVGQFDTQFFMYSEESDLCKRIQNMGYKIALSDETIICHQGAKSTPSQFFQINNIHVSELLFVKKHNNLLYYQTYKLFNSINKLLRGMLTGVVGIFSNHEINKQKSTALIKTVYLNCFRPRYALPNKR